MDLKNLQETFSTDELSFIDKDLFFYGTEHGIEANDILFIQILRELKRLK